jgi:hypothetical protein
MDLPGGVLRDGVRRRDFAFRPVDGSLEAALVDAADAPTVPSAVTAVLVASLAELGGAPPDAQAVADLAVGDRQFLARRLGLHLGHDPLWCTAVCGACDGRFDVEVRQGELPVKVAGDTFPHVEVGSLRLRVPTGADQEAIAHLPDEQAVPALIARCRIEGDDGADAGADAGAHGGDVRGGDVRGGDVRGGDAEVDLAGVEQALEAAAPEVALAVLATCPLCDADNELAVDPYAGVLVPDEGVFDDIHRLASSYHWSETDILRLTRDRRQRYLRLLDRAGGHGP